MLASVVSPSQSVTLAVRFRLICRGLAWWLGVRRAVSARVSAGLVLRAPWPIVSEGLSAGRFSVIRSFVPWALIVTLPAGEMLISPVSCLWLRLSCRVRGRVSVNDLILAPYAPALSLISRRGARCCQAGDRHARDLCRPERGQDVDAILRADADRLPIDRDVGPATDGTHRCGRTKLGHARPAAGWL